MLSPPQPSGGNVSREGSHEGADLPQRVPHKAEAAEDVEAVLPACDKQPVASACCDWNGGGGSGAYRFERANNKRRAEITGEEKGEEEKRGGTRI